MFEAYFQQYMDDHASPFFETANRAMDALEQTIRKRYTLEEYVDLFEDAITECCYEMERAAFYMGFAKGMCAMSQAATLAAEVKG